MKNSEIKNLGDVKNRLENLVVFPGTDWEMKMQNFVRFRNGGLAIENPDGYEIFAIETENGIEIQCFCQGYLVPDFTPELFENAKMFFEFLIGYPDNLEIRTIIPNSIPTWKMVE